MGTSATPRRPSVEGFELVHSGFYAQMRCLWEVVGVTVGEETEFDLLVRIFDRRDREEIIRFRDAASFRVHHETAIDDYWCIRGNEGIKVGLLYTIRSSRYLRECSGYRKDGELRHYLIAAIGLCVEVLAGDPPILPPGWDVLPPHSSPPRRPTAP